MSSDAEEQRVPGTGEQEPLLGRTGDAAQREEQPIYMNFVLGTGVVAQMGVWVLTAIVWGSVFSHPDKLMLFSAHPLLNSAAVLFFVQAILVVQPTHTKEQKRHGTYWHAGLNNVALAAAVAGLVIIEYNKIDHGGEHFVSPHAILGLIVYILVVIQAFVGVTQYFTPGLYGGEEKAKALYKYHRMSGYLVIVLMLATVCAATQTDFNTGVLQMQLWAVIVASVILLVGLLARVKKQKLGFQ